jgi:hypothetical protein
VNQHHGRKDAERRAPVAAYVQAPSTAGELARVRHSVVRGTPFGETGHFLREFCLRVEFMWLLHLHQQAVEVDAVLAGDRARVDGAEFELAGNENGVGADGNHQEIAGGREGAEVEDAVPQWQAEVNFGRQDENGNLLKPKTR